MEDDAKHRAKLYELNSEGQWLDRGTGFASCAYSNNVNDSALILAAESSGEPLLEVRLAGSVAFSRQSETIITWTEPEDSIEFALSFQEGQGVNAIWSSIPFSLRASPDPPSDDDRTEPIHSAHDLSDLTEVTYGELGKWVEATIDPPHGLATYLTSKFVDGTMLSEMVTVFDTASELEDKESMHGVFSILRGMLAFSEPQIFEVAVRDEHFDSVLAILDADPGLVSPPGHRQFMNHGVVYREIVALPDDTIRKRIASNFRIMYIKDVALNRLLSDAALNQISHVVLTNSHEIVSDLSSSAEYVGNIFKALFSAPSHLPPSATGTMQSDTPVTRGDVLRLVQELAAIIRMNTIIREKFFRSLCSYVAAEDVPASLQPAKHSLLPALDFILCDTASTVKEKLSCMDILLSFIQSDSTSVRTYIQDTSAKVPPPPPDGIYDAQESQPTEHAVKAKDALRCSLLGAIVAAIVSQADSGLQVLASQVLAKLILPGPVDMGGDPRESGAPNEFLELFYKHFLHWLLYPFCPAIVSEKNNATLQPNMVAERNDLLEDMPLSAIKSAKLCVTEALCSYVEPHGFRMKYYVLRENVGSKLLLMSKYPDRYLQIAALRFLRVLVASAETFYSKYIVKSRLLDPAFVLLDQNMERDNMVSSNVLELMKLIGSMPHSGEGPSDLLQYVLDHAERFQRGIAKSTFEGLLLHTVTARSPGGPAPDPSSDAIRRQSEAERKADEEDRFFDDDDDDEDVAGDALPGTEGMSDLGTSNGLQLPSIAPAKENVAFLNHDQRATKPKPKLALRMHASPKIVSGIPAASAAAPAPAPAPVPSLAPTLSDEEPVSVHQVPKVLEADGWVVQGSPPKAAKGMVEESSPSPSPSSSASSRAHTPRPRSAEQESAMDEESPSPKRPRTPTQKR